MTRSRGGFTLIELLIVIGILAVLSVTAVLVINPTQLFAQSRDARRLNEIQTINRALQYANFYGISGGTVHTVYISVPDTSPTCANLTGLPALTAGWSYACSTQANFRKNDGTGWLPLNFAATGVSILAQLPIDPQNTVTNGYYYSYIPGSWVLTAKMESEKYLAANAATDNGSDASRVEIGTEITLWGQSGAGGTGTINTTPTANSQSVSTAFNTPVTITLVATDPEQCDLTFTVLASPANGSLSPLTNQTCATGSPNSDSASVVYTPNTGFSGTNTFTFKVNDGIADSATATVTVTVNPSGNTLPTAENRVLTTTTGVATTATLYGKDPEQCELTFSIVTGPAHGTLSGITNQNCVAGSPNSDSATVVYTPTSGYYGSDLFTYKTNDGIGDSATNGTVSVTVNLPAPTATAINPASGTNNASVSITSITGTNFVSPVTAKLKKTGQSDITMTGCTASSATSITGCSANINGAATGAWDVQVAIADGQTATLTGGFTVNAAGSSAPTAGLVGYWSLDNTTADFSGQGNTGTWNGTASWVTGKVGQAVTMDGIGVDDYIEIANSASLENVQEGDYTMAVWVNPNSVPPGIGSDNNANYGIFIKTGWHEGLYYTGASQFGFSHWLTGNIGEGVTSAGTYPAGTWYHVVGVVDKTNGIAKLYVNGVLDGTTSWTPGTAAREFNQTTWKIGIANPGATSYRWAADAKIDEVRIWNRALTASEISGYLTW